MSQAELSLCLRELSSVTSVNSLLAAVILLGEDGTQGTLPVLLAENGWRLCIIQRPELDSRLLVFCAVKQRLPSRQRDLNARLIREAEQEAGEEGWDD